MSCHRSTVVQAITAALQRVDPAVGGPGWSWHSHDLPGGGDPTPIPGDQAAIAVKAALKAAPGRKNLTPLERLRMYRDEKHLLDHLLDGELQMTDNQVRKLAAYVRKNRPELPLRTRAMAAGAAGLIAVTGVLGASPAAAAPVNTSKGTSATLVHTDRDGKSCPDGWVKARAKTTHRAWVLTDTGDVERARVKKGTRDCVQPLARSLSEAMKGNQNAAKPDWAKTAKKQDLEPTVRKDGTIKALPAAFPKNPTPADIRYLGEVLLAGVKPDPYRPGIVPMPDPSTAPAPEYPDSVEYVRTNTTETYTDGWGETFHVREWRVHGGVGLTRTLDENGKSVLVELPGPGKSMIIRAAAWPETQTLSEQIPHIAHLYPAGAVQIEYQKSTEQNLGQQYLPEGFRFSTSAPAPDTGDRSGRQSTKRGSSGSTTIGWEHKAIITADGQLIKDNP